MKKAHIDKPCFILALLLLHFALAFTVAGVTRWPILIFAAAPCYFLFTLLILSACFLEPENKPTVENVMSGNWF